MVITSCDSVEKLRAKLPTLESEIQDSMKFKDVYQFTFNYAKNQGQKGLDLEMAVAYWNIILRGRFKFLDLWCNYLQVISCRDFQNNVQSELRVNFCLC